MTAQGLARGCENCRNRKEISALRACAFRVHDRAVKAEKQLRESERELKTLQCQVGRFGRELATLQREVETLRGAGSGGFGGLKRGGDEIGADGLEDGNGRKRTFTERVSRLEVNVLGRVVGPPMALEPRVAALEVELAMQEGAKQRIHAP